MQSLVKRGLVTREIRDEHGDKFEFYPITEKGKAALSEECPMASGAVRVSTECPKCGAVGRWHKTGGGYRCAKCKAMFTESESALAELPERVTEEAELGADGNTTCGVFIPVPFNLARLFPDKSEHDDSVPHYTLLFAGDLSPDQYSVLMEVVRIVAREYEPFAMTMTGYHEFVNVDGQTIAHMGATPNLGVLHADLRRAAERAGLPIAHTYGPGEDDRPYADQFKTHATLAYVDEGEPPYDGPKPTGTWRVTELEVWGHEKYRVPLGKTTADQPAGGDE